MHSSSLRLQSCCRFYTHIESSKHFNHQCTMYIFGISTQYFLVLFYCRINLIRYYFCLFFAQLQTCSSVIVAKNRYLLNINIIFANKYPTLSPHQNFPCDALNASFFLVQTKMYKAI